MSTLWREMTLLEITSKLGSGSTPRGGKAAYKTEGIPLIRSMNVHDGYFFKKNLAFIDESQAEKLSNVIVEKGDVLLNITGASIARCCVVPDAFVPARVNQHVAILRPVERIVNGDFLSYLLISRQYKQLLLNSGNKAGATREALTKAELQKFKVLIPALEEQKRIVTILDQAFADIEKARANAEQNLKNARELFDSYLQQVFSERGEGWVEKRLVDVCVLQRGFDLPTRLRVNGKFPLVSSSGITDSHSDAKVAGPGVVTGRSGSIGNVFYIEGDFWPLNTTLYIKEFYGNDVKFVSWLLRNFDLSRFTSGAGVPVVV